MYFINFIKLMLTIITIYYFSYECLYAKIQKNKKISQKIIQKTNYHIYRKLYYNSNIDYLILTNKNQSKKYESKINLLIQQAKSYIGTSYEYGGTTIQGIDCSAFVKNVYSILHVNLNRISSNQALQGEIISLKTARKGDLLFFAHPGDSISHVGIIEHISHKNKKIFFIHAAASRGVLINSLNDDYWIKRYRKTIRIIE